MDARAAGVWAQSRRGRRIAVSVEPFGPLRPAVTREVRAEVARLGEFLGGRVEVTFGG